MASSDIQPIVGITIFSINIDVIVISVAKLGHRIIEITEAFTVSKLSMENVQIRWICIGWLQDHKGIDFTVESFVGKKTGILLLSVDEGDGIICK